MTRFLVKYLFALHYLLLTDNGEPKCYEEALQVEDKIKWRLLWMMSLSWRTKH